MKLSAPIFRLKRQARLLARDAGLPLHKALDQIARAEGFRSWSHLAARHASGRPAAAILDALNPGDMVLLGARPGQGKTQLGLSLAVEAARAGRTACFFTLEYTPADVLALLRAEEAEPANLAPHLILDTSDDICAGHIIARMAETLRGAMAVIDYFQLLDQKRYHPPLDEQVRMLKAFAAETGTIIVMISQIDRSFDAAAGGLPCLADVRLPNPVDLSLFTRTCFLHDGEIRLDAAA